MMHMMQMDGMRCKRLWDLSFPSTLFLDIFCCKQPWYFNLFPPWHVGPRLLLHCRPLRSDGPGAQGTGVRHGNLLDFGGAHHGALNRTGGSTWQAGRGPFLTICLRKWPGLCSVFFLFFSFFWGGGDEIIGSWTPYFDFLGIKSPAWPLNLVVFSKWFFKVFHLNHLQWCEWPNHQPVDHGL